MSEQFERIPARTRLIKHLKKDDKRVKVVGIVIKKDLESSSILLDDGTGSVIVIIPSENDFKKVQIGSTVRVFGIVLPYDEGVELRAEIIQNFNNIDKDLYNEIYNLIYNEEKNLPITNTP